MKGLWHTHPAHQPALIDPGAGRTVTYGELHEQVTAAALQLQQTGSRRLIFLYAAPSIDGVLAYLAAVRANCPVCLLEPDSAGQLSERLLAAYTPDALVLPAGQVAPPEYVNVGPWPTPQFQLWSRITGPTIEHTALHPDLALLLTTSGSTGDPKLVRLTTANLEANAVSIAQYLGLSPDERAVQSLPMAYSYGLSIINSHLAAGGAIIFPRSSFMWPDFWTDFVAGGCTSFAGVPFMYESLAKLRFQPAKYPLLKTMTQAGGPLSAALVGQFHEKCTATGARLFVMYGQTEATARMSYLPPEFLPDKIGSIGRAIPGGTLSLESIGADSPYAELIYRGPNVMQGYATQRACLARGDDQQGLLRTGDLGRVDADGCFVIEGRLKRFAKLLGRRVNLADVEASIEAHFPAVAAAIDAGEHLGLFVEVVGSGEVSDPESAELTSVELTAVQQHVCQMLSLPPRLVQVVQLDRLPRTSAGKKDYRALAE